MNGPQEPQLETTRYPTTFHRAGKVGGILIGAFNLVQFRLSSKTLADARFRVFKLCLKNFDSKALCKER